MACSFYSSALLLGNISLRMDRTATQLSPTLAQPLVSFSSPASQLIKEAKPKKELFHSPAAVRLCVAGGQGGRVWWGRAACKVGSASLKGEEESPEGQSVLPAALSRQAPAVHPSLSRAQAQDNAFGENRGQNGGIAQQQCGEYSQRNSAGFQMEPLALAQPPLCWASLCFWKQSRAYRFIAWGATRKHSTANQKLRQGLQLV